MKNINWHEIEDTQQRYPEKPLPGGYVCRIYAIEEHDDKEYLVLYFDIAEGPSTGYMEASMNFYGSWPAMGKTVRSYSERSLSWFRSFVRALEESNEDFQWTSAVNEEPCLICGLEFGAILAMEEYRNMEGDVREVLRVRTICSADRIRSGHYTVPGCKRLPDGSNPAPVSSSLPAGYTTLEDDDDGLPF